MKILLYNDLEIKPVKKQFDKTIEFLKVGNFTSADVKKMPNTGFYRAKLDDTNRLLFKIGKCNNEVYILLLEVILNHDYANARFLNGAEINEANFVSLPANEKPENYTDLQELSFVNAKKKHFYFLDKFISFDDIQEEIMAVNAPCIIIGSAGSGKTAITLEKLKSLQGKILYTTLSPYLSENAANLYSSFNYENEKQEVDFMSFNEYLCSINIPTGKEIDYRTFDYWATKFKQQHKIKDTHSVYEEFKGVITGSNHTKAYLSKDDYLNLGIKQSIFSKDDRALVYDLFVKYLDWMKTENYYDSNIYSFQLQDKIEPLYDYVMIDEVQDITNVQLATVLKSLKSPSHFILSGDSNQIVHPNFFSWSQIKTLFYQQELKGDIVRILATNYRNTAEVTTIANQLLMIKNTRFGSIDKESTYLVESNSKHKGVVEFLENNPKSNADINLKTRTSTQFAVLVLRNEDKAMAKKYFQTPLLFSIQEAKGLEYENIILFDFISSNEKVFRELCNGVNKEDLTEENFKFSRNKDKSDKSIDEYKFYINSLYVGITRAVKNLYVIESNKKHDLLHLLNLTDFKTTTLQNQQSSREEWLREAAKLAKQGKQEQADAINEQIIKIEKVPYQVFDFEQLLDLVNNTALNPSSFNKKAKDKLYDYAILNQDVFWLVKLNELKYSLAGRPAEGQLYLKRIYKDYIIDSVPNLMPKINKYGIDYRNEQGFTPFMLACYFGSTKIAHYLAENGAKLTETDMYGRNGLQLAIMNASVSGKFVNVTKLIGLAYNFLKNESIKLKIDNKMVKIDSHQGEYWIVQQMFGLSQNLISRSLVDFGTNIFTANLVETFANLLPANAMPDHRRKRTYISSLLAKNEIDRDDKYNKKLFVRLKTGYYVFNFEIEIMIGDKWFTQRELYGLNAYTKFANSSIAFSNLKAFK